MIRRLIVTADDFGLAIPVNEAVEESHRQGILTAASLIVGAVAAEDAVSRAKKLPTLKVGLHLVLVEGRPVLAPEQVPDLVDKNGEFSVHLVRSGFKFFFIPRVRRQLEAEIRAQFQAFKNTGLGLDHVNAHNHMHLHPTVLGLILKVGREFGLKSVRVPYEPRIPSWRASKRYSFKKFSTSVFLFPWIALLRRRLKKANVRSNDYMFGMQDSGRMNTECVLKILRQIPPGTSEIYFHPATCRSPELDRTMPDYQHRSEFEALMDPKVMEALLDRDIQRIAFGDI